MKLTTKAIAIAAAATLAFGSTAGMTFAAAPGGGPGAGGNAGAGNAGRSGAAVSAPSNSSFDSSSNFKTAGPSGISFGGNGSAPSDSDMPAPPDFGGNGSAPSDSDMPAPPDFGGNGSAPSDSDMPAPPDFGGNGSAPSDSDMPAPPDFGGNAQGEAPDLRELAAKIIEENGLEGYVIDEMSDDDIAALLEQYKPDMGEMNGRPEMPEMNNQNSQTGRPEAPDFQNAGQIGTPDRNANNGIVNVIANIISKILEDNNLSIDNDALTTDKIAEYISQFAAEINRPAHPDFQNGETPADINEDINNNANAA